MSTVIVDDPAWSNFWKYFHENFDSLGLKILISTYYRKDSELSYAMIYDGGDDFNVQAGENIEIRGNKAVVNGREVLYSAGDFRSDACLRFMEEADIISTNPPFSLFREHVSCLIEYNKKFLILGNQNASTTKEIFPLFKENKIWYGESIHSGGVDFRMPDDYEEYSNDVFIRNGHHYINLAGIRWFTNMDVKYRHDGLWHQNGKFDDTQAHCYYEGREDAYPKYDNYDAIEIGKTKDIPIDYPDVMGVPITWLDKFSPEEFEILGITDRQNTSGLRHKKYTIEDSPKYNDLNARSVLLLKDGTYKQMYARILIGNLHPIKNAEEHERHDSNRYPKYDNYDAIEVGRTKDIPIDYEGIIGVPVTFLDKFNHRRVRDNRSIRTVWKRVLGRALARIQRSGASCC